MDEIETLGCYCGFIDRQRAEALLSQLPYSCFLMRQSSNGGYAISLWSPDAPPGDKFSHFLLLEDPETGRYLLGDRDLTDYATISELLDNSPILLGFQRYSSDWKEHLHNVPAQEDPQLAASPGPSQGSRAYALTPSNPAATLVPSSSSSNGSAAAASAASTPSAASSVVSGETGVATAADPSSTAAAAADLEHPVSAPQQWAPPPAEPATPTKAATVGAAVWPSSDATSTPASESDSALPSYWEVASSYSSSTEPIYSATPSAIRQPAGDVPPTPPPQTMPEPALPAVSSTDPINVYGRTPVRLGAAPLSSESSPEPNPRDRSETLAAEAATVSDEISADGTASEDVHSTEDAEGKSGAGETAGDGHHRKSAGFLSRMSRTISGVLWKDKDDKARSRNGSTADGSKARPPSTDAGVRGAPAKEGGESKEPSSHATDGSAPTRKDSVGRDKPPTSQPPTPTPAAKEELEPHVHEAEASETRSAADAAVRASETDGQTPGSDERRATQADSAADATTDAECPASPAHEADAKGSGVGSASVGSSPTSAGSPEERVLRRHAGSGVRMGSARLSLMEPTLTDGEHSPASPLSAAAAAGARRGSHGGGGSDSFVSMGGGGGGGDRSPPYLRRGRPTDWTPAAPSAVVGSEGRARAPSGSSYIDGLSALSSFSGTSSQLVVPSAASVSHPPGAPAAADSVAPPSTPDGNGVAAAAPGSASPSAGGRYTLILAVEYAHRRVKLTTAVDSLEELHDRIRQRLGLSGPLYVEYFDKDLELFVMVEDLNVFEHGKGLVKVQLDSGSFIVPPLSAPAQVSAAPVPSVPSSVSASASASASVSLSPSASASASVLSPVVAFSAAAASPVPVIVGATIAASPTAASAHSAGGMPAIAATLVAADSDVARTSAASPGDRSHESGGSAAVSDNRVSPPEATPDAVPTPADACVDPPPQVDPSPASTAAAAPVANSAVAAPSAVAGAPASASSFASAASPGSVSVSVAATLMAPVIGVAQVPSAVPVGVTSSAQQRVTRAKTAPSKWPASGPNSTPGSRAGDGIPGLASDTDTAESSTLPSASLSSECDSDTCADALDSAPHEPGKGAAVQGDVGVQS